MECKHKLFAVLLIVLVASVPAAAQEQKVMKIEGENVFLLQEIMLVLNESEGKVTVQMDPPAMALTGKNKDIDIKAGDVIMMMNGERIKTTAAMKEIYGKLEIGDEIKLGVKRGEEMFIVRFEKADPEEAPKGMIIRREIKDGEPEEKED